jgi:hypothetical protein
LGKGSNPLKKREAEAIARKLGATVEKSGAHQRAYFEHAGKLVLSFGIRHGRDSGHGHIPKDMSLSQYDTVRMANCTMSKADYLIVLRDKGMIDKI